MTYSRFLHVVWPEEVDIEKALVIRVGEVVPEMRMFELASI